MQYDKLTHSGQPGGTGLIYTFAERGWTLHSIHIAAGDPGELGLRCHRAAGPR